MRAAVACWARIRSARLRSAPGTVISSGGGATPEPYRGAALPTPPSWSKMGASRDRDVLEPPRPGQGKVGGEVPPEGSDQAQDRGTASGQAYARPERIEGRGERIPCSNRCPQGSGDSGPAGPTDDPGGQGLGPQALPRRREARCGGEGPDPPFAPVGGTSPETHPGHGRSAGDRARRFPSSSCCSGSCSPCRSAATGSSCTGWPLSHTHGPVTEPQPRRWRRCPGRHATAPAPPCSPTC